MVPGNQRKTKGKRALTVKAGVACAAVAAGAVGAVLLFQRLGVTAQAASITTYEVAAVSYGDVDTTISGSGTLTPLSQDTLTAAGPVTLTAVNCAAGDTVGSGTVIAPAEDAAGETVEYTAPTTAWCWRSPWRRRTTGRWGRGGHGHGHRRLYHGHRRG